MAELPDNVIWRKSSRSGGGANCVEIALLPEAAAAIRDSKNPDGPRLTLGASGWVALRRTVDFPRFRP